MKAFARQLAIFVLLACLMASLGLPLQASVSAAPSYMVNSCAGDLFFSEYIEGSSYNKALEIYNGTGAAINLGNGNYVVELYNNGNSSPNSSYALSGTLADGDTFVIAESRAAAAILNVADATASVANFNGDDAIVLRKNGAIVDVIGQIGFDPGTQWGSGATTTRDDTLVRNASVTSGDSNGSDAFDPAVEWTGFPQNTFTNLGSHSINCGGGGGGTCNSSSLTLISTIQGSGAASPLAGSTVTVEAVVVGDFQDTTTQLSGFYLQEESAESDGNPSTSEGIFIYDNGFGVDVAVGDQVEVQGTVVEFNNLTELNAISSVAVCSSGNSVPPTAVNLPFTSLTDLEAYEGMLVTFPQTLYATEHFNIARFGEVALALNGRQMNPTQIAAPGAAANAVGAQNDLERIYLDDGSSQQNPAVVPYLGSDNTLRAGESLAGLTGVVDYSFGKYKIHPTASVSFTNSNPRPSAPPAVGGRMQVAAYNVLNYFTTIDTGPTICGPSGTLGCRGADSAVEFTRQRDKIVDAIATLDAEVVGLIELENNATTSLQDLINGINAAVGAGTYSFINTGTIGSDAIKVGIIYKSAEVTPSGNFAVLDSSVDPTFNDSKNRPALAQTFTENSSGAAFTVVVNHFKSKGSNCNSLGDPDTGDGQGNCNLTRTSAATALVNWLATDPTNSGDDDIIILGDLNAYAMEDPITAIEAAGYTDLAELYLGSSAYSFAFDGEWGTLDYGLATSSLTAQTTGAGEWHVNADEPRSLDYNTEFNPAYLYTPDAFRSSDHDPFIVGLDLTAANASSDLVYVSSTTGGNAGGVGFTDEDILSWDPSTSTWAMVFDGSDVGLGGAGARDTRAFHILDDGSILLSITAASTLPNVGSVDDSDIVRFIPTTLGTATTGTFEMYLDGSDVGLTTNAEDIDAISVLDNGDIIISTLGSFNVPGASGADEDLARFTPTQLGANTSGSWAVYFDGSDVGLSTNSGEDVWGVSVDGATGDIYLTTSSNFSVPGVSGDSSDIFVCTPSSLGAATACSYAGYFDGSAEGYAGESMDGLHIGPTSSAKWASGPDAPAAPDAPTAVAVSSTAAHQTNAVTLLLVLLTTLIALTAFSTRWSKR